MYEASAGMDKPMERATMKAIPATIVAMPIRAVAILTIMALPGTTFSIMNVLYYSIMGLSSLAINHQSLAINI
jgi:hypothetical protein